MIFLDDRSLLDRFRRAERGALEAVYRSYLADVVALVRSGFVLGDARIPGVADRGAQLDVAHDVFLKAFSQKGRSSYDGLRPYRPFLLRIAKNALIDRARASGREIAVDQEALDAELPPASVDGAEERLHWERLRAGTQAFLAGNDDELRTLVRLRFEEGLSQAQVAEAMKITRRRVRTVEQRARDGLEAFLRARGLTR